MARVTSSTTGPNDALSLAAVTGAGAVTLAVTGEPPAVEPAAFATDRRASAS